MFSLIIVLFVSFGLLLLQQWRNTHPIVCMTLLPYGFTYCIIQIINMIMKDVPLMMNIVGSIVCLLLLTAFFIQFYLDIFSSIKRTKETN